MTAPQSPPDDSRDTEPSGFTEQGEAAEQSAFRGDGEYSGGGFAAGPEELTGAEGEPAPPG